MGEKETSARLTVIIYSGSKGCLDHSAIAEWYRNLGLEKPKNLLEFAIDRSEAVHDLSLSPKAKLFLQAPFAIQGGQLTPLSSVQLFEYNRRTFIQMINAIMEQARKIRANEIRILCLLTYVGGTGFTTALRLAFMLKNRLIGRIPVSVHIFGTAPPLEMMESPENATDAMKIVNTEFAFRTLVATAPVVDLAYIRFPHEILTLEPRLPYLLRALSYLPTDNCGQVNLFQPEQLMAVSNEKCYPLVLQTSIVIRFPKLQLKQREIAESKLPKLRQDQLKLQQLLNDMNKKLSASSQPIENEIRETSERIVRNAGIRSKKWQRILLESQKKLEKAKYLLQNGLDEHKIAEETIEDSLDRFQQILDLIKKLEILLAQLDEELSTGYYKHNLHVLAISPKERTKLGPYSVIETMPLSTIMAKLGREKELFDLTQRIIEEPVSQIFLDTLGLKFPKNTLPMENWKVVASASENISHLRLEPDVHLVSDPLLRDEIVIVALSMVDLESPDGIDGFELVDKFIEAREKWNIPVSKRISLRVSDKSGKKPEEFVLQTRLSSKERKRSELIGEDEHLWRQLF